MKVLYENDLERTKKNLDNTETTRQEETRENEVQERSSQKNEIEVSIDPIRESSDDPIRESSDDPIRESYNDPIRGSKKKSRRHQSSNINEKRWCPRTPYGRPPCSQNTTEEKTTCKDKSL